MFTRRLCRHALAGLAGLALLAAPALLDADSVAPASTQRAPATCPCGNGPQAGQGHGHRHGQRPNPTTTPATAPSTQARTPVNAHATIADLFANHLKIKRTVEDIDGGIRATTTGDTPAVALAIKTHVKQMKARLESGHPMRRFDPLFRELFAHYDKITMDIKDLPNGVEVTETSKDPQVVLLIRQHAHAAVSEFVKQGDKIMHNPTPLPKGYKPAK